MKWMPPDYQNSILNLACSVQRHFGVSPRHDTLPQLDSWLAQGRRNVVVLVFDALGSHNLAQLLPPDSFLRRHQLGALSSVFPSTTTAAITTLESGLSPIEHGWLGWNLRFAELGKTVDLFTNNGEDGLPAADYHVAERYMPYDNLADQVSRAGRARGERVEPFAGRRVSGMEELLDTVGGICREPGGHYVFGYWTEPDGTMHRTGVCSAESRQWALRIDRAVAGFCAGLRDTLVIITADHGHLDCQNECLEDYPELRQTLRWNPTMEARALSFAARPGREQDLCSAFSQHFGRDFLLLSQDEAVRQGFFGPGTPHPRFARSLGDYLGVAVGERALYANRELCRKFIGSHAGLTEQEMQVPLIVAAT